MGFRRSIPLLLLAPWLFDGLSSSCQSIEPSAPVAQAPAIPGDLYAHFPDWMRHKRWTEIAERAGELHRESPSDTRALYWLGISKLQLHESVAAVRAFRSAEKLGLNTALFHEDLGLAYYELNQFVLFEEQMRKSSQLDASDSKPHYYLGLYLWTVRSDVGRALAQFEEAIKLQPDDWKSVYQAGNCLEQLGKLDQARERYTSAITLVEKQGAPFGWPYQGMARLLLEDRPQEALTFAQRAVALEPAEPSNHLLLAKIYERLGNLGEAIREAKIAADENPTDSATHYALFKLYRRAGDARASEEGKLFEEVKAVYDPD